MHERTRHQNIILVCIVGMTLLFGALMLISMTRRGVVLADSLLRVQKQQGVTDTAVYSGKVRGERVTVSVRENGVHYTVAYTVEDRIQDEYEIVYPAGTISCADEQGREIPRIQIARNGRLYFQGGYDPNASFFQWYDRTGHVDADAFMSYGGSADRAPDVLQNTQLAALAIDPVLTARGSWLMYGLLLVLSCILAVDVAYPTFWFTLRHSCDVRNPEPTDFYIAMQRVGWAIYPVLLCIGYLMALYQLP